MNTGCFAPVHEIPVFCCRGNTCSFGPFPLKMLLCLPFYTCNNIPLYHSWSVANIGHLFTHFCTMEVKASLLFFPPPVPNLLCIGGYWKGCPLNKSPATWTAVVNFPPYIGNGCKCPYYIDSVCEQPLTVSVIPPSYFG